MTETIPGTSLIGTLAGTLVLDPAQPVSRISIAPQMSTTSVKMYYTYQNRLYEDSLDGYLYMDYYQTNGTRISVNLTNKGSSNFQALDASRPITFYVLVEESAYNSFISKVRRFFLWGLSPNKFVAMGSQPAFSLFSSSNTAYTILSNQGESLLPTPIVGGGLSGPAGERTIFIGDPGVSSFLYIYNISDEPIYTIAFADLQVTIDQIEQAAIAPVPLTNVLLYVENYQNTYLGESRVNVRFYQVGYPSFRFIHSANSSIQLPYTLWTNQTEVPYNMPFSPWPAPMTAINEQLISLKVDQQDIDNAIEGLYITTITVEIINGI